MEIITKVYDNIQARHHYSFEITFKYEGFTSTIRITEPYLCSQEDWNDFYNAIHDGTCVRLDFYQGNGIGDLDCSEDELIFHAMPSGEGGDVSVRVAIPLKNCREMFLEKLRAMLNHEIVVKYNLGQQKNVLGVKS